MDEKAGLPPYSAAELPLPNAPRQRCLFRGKKLSARRSRVLKFVAVACLALIVLGQWRQVWRDDSRAPKLSLEKLNDDLATCRKFRHKPQDPIGLGRDKSARYVDGGKPTLIKNATIWVGEPAKGTGYADARAGKGWEWINGDVFLEHGLIKRVEAAIPPSSLPKDTVVFDAAGRQLTSGVIDMHSHAGVDSIPSLNGYDDTNEISGDITPWARSIDGLNPLDHQIEVIKSGGVTTSLILPGSANNMGGEAFVVKLAVGPQSGRKEISAQDMLADPDRNWRFMKMACGENPKRVYGGIGKGPASRMGESYEFRHAFEQARALIQKQDDWCDKAEAAGVDKVDGYLPQELQWESLSAALRGQVHINIHCYTIADLEAMVDHTNEFKFAVRAFHHAHQTFLVPEILKRTWGGRPPASALFADNMFYKQEAFVASEYAGKYLWDANLTTVYVSDNPVINAQHVLFEAAKGYHYGLPYHAALAAVTTAPAELLGFGERLGKIKPGFDADVVVWDSDPLSVGAAPVQVWIDGSAQFEHPVELSKPHTGPIVPDESLAKIIEEPTEVEDVIFHGITKVLLDDETHEASDKPFDVFVSKGKIACIGLCAPEFAAAARAAEHRVELKNGYLVNSFTGVAGLIGLNEIDAEDSTDNGNNKDAFTRAVDGLQLDGQKLQVAAKYGVTKGITAPKYTDLKTHHGTSVGFVTAAKTIAEEGAIFAPDVAVHYTLDVNVHASGSYTEMFGKLRKKLIQAVKADKPAEDPFSEEAYLKKVVEGKQVLALTINSADSIATALKIKSEVEEFTKSSKIKLAIIGGAEAHLVAKELGAADAGVILLPLQAHPNTWDQRRTLPGAPLTNGTTIDFLLDAGVTVAIGLAEDWYVRDLGFEAGAAYHNGNGRLTEKEALDLVSVNPHKILGGEVPKDQAKEHFIVSEGSPLNIGSKVKAVGAGRGTVAVYM
ncbi:hypothetical protein PT974_05095 [Cladobotryum mycophilum]|uniref:Amidohydrolase 3 domain-containing protein n=1 Tax=Cladobotryum mycophilum TaxID=491253 RepID=A0ABR0SR09_9HYPO